METLFSALSNPISLAKDFIAKGHTRSIKAKKNILFLLVVKGGNIAISLLLVPMTISYINPTKYGIWMTLSSVVGWLGFFDIGFGNGLRNKLTESISKGRDDLAQIYVSTTYAAMSIFSLIFIGIFLIANKYIFWATILNAPANMESELSTLAQIILAFFSLQFVLQLVITVMTANHEPGKASIINFFASALSLIGIYFLTKFTTGSLLYLAIVLSGTPVVVMAIVSLWLYRFDYFKYAPNLKLVDFSYAKDLMRLGVKFFIMQIGVLILFQTDNIIISQVFGPTEVTHFAICFKLFSVITMGFTIVVTPLWSAYTEAYTNSDFDWIKSSLKKMKKIWMLLSVATVVLLFFSPYIFKIWLGDKIEIPFILSLCMCMYTIAYAWQTIQVMFLNGIGKIRLQLYLIIVSSLLNIPLAIFLGKTFGLAGTVLANTILFVIMGGILSMQTRRILKNNAKGIWNK